MKEMQDAAPHKGGSGRVNDFFAVSLKNSNVRVLLNIKTETPIVSIRSCKDICICFSI